MELMAPFLIACALLVGAGVAKAVRPRDTARALALLVHLPLGPLVPLVRVGAVAEALLGLVALIAPRPGSAALVALSYLLFAVVVAVARVTGGPLATCGCFGTPDTPATAVHMALNVVLASAAAVVSVSAPTTGSLWTWSAGQPAHGVPLLLASALGTYLAYLAMSDLARLEAVRRLVGIRHRSEAGS